MTRSWSPVLVGVAVAVLTGVPYGPSWAQHPTTGGLGGWVQQLDGVPLSGALLTLSDESTGLEHAASTQLDGSFAFALLPAGEYTLHMEKLGYAPKRITGIPVRSGGWVHLEATLPPLAGQDGVGEERFGGTALRGGRPGSTLWWSGADIRAFPAAGRDAAELARFTSRATEELAVEGLPPWLSLLRLDGMEFRPASHPSLRATPYSGIGLASGWIASAELGTNVLDTESGGAAGALLSVQTLRGPERLVGAGQAHWTGSTLPVPRFPDGDAPPYNEVQATLGLRGPLAERARFSAGLDLRQLVTPLSAAWSGSPAAAALAGLGQAAGLDLESYRRTTLASADGLTGFARLDWSLAPRHDLAAILRFASLPRVGGFDDRTGTRPELDGRDAMAGISLLSAVSARAGNDLRVTLTTSNRATTDVSAVAPTTIVSEGLALGGRTAVVSGEETQFLVQDAVHIRAGAHAFKFGGALRFTGHAYEHRAGTEDEFFFGDLDQLEARTGVFVRTETTVGGVEWWTPHAALFAQDRWSTDGGLELLLGARLERESLPLDGVQQDDGWLALSGLSNSVVEQAPSWRPGVRVGLTWDWQNRHEWIAFAGAGLFHDRVDPLLLGQWQVDDGGQRTRRDVGAVDWPQPLAGGDPLQRLTLLGPGFAPPRTARFSAGLSHRLAGTATITLAGVFRRTENLPRRADLNLLPLPAMRDQYGRAIYGTLLQQGGLLVADPRSGRRFDNYDEVAGITADGWSDHWGLTVGLARETMHGLGLNANYTFSGTVDNWFAARAGGWTVPLPRGLDDEGDWAEGTSDFDVPHVAVVGVVVPVPFGARITALYRFQSGAPFTAGYRAGVDADGDGSARNDPAFVDPAFPGMAELMQAWPCLRASSDRIAVRNSCRAPATHSLDLAIGLHLLQAGGLTAALTADVLDVFESDRRLPDGALFLIDPAGSLVTDDVARTVAVPLLLNPRFGADAAHPQSGRKLRLGFSVNW